MSGAGNGIRNMTQRARALGGDLLITSARPRGTRLEWRAPAPAADPPAAPTAPAPPAAVPPAAVPPAAGPPAAGPPAARPPFPTPPGSPAGAPPVPSRCQPPPTTRHGT